jgi:hypothetical protein
LFYTQLATQSTDEEIYPDACENIDRSGSDDVDFDDGPAEARPTIGEVQQAAVILSRYIDKLNDPIARKLETILGSFNHQLHLDQAESM